MTKEKVMAREDRKAVKAGLQFKDALKLAGSIIERRTTIPVLSCVQLTAPGRVRSTDLDLHLSVDFDGSRLGLTKDAILVPQQELSAAVKDTDGSVAVELRKAVRYLRVGDSLVVRIRANPDDLPEPTAFDVGSAFSLSAAELADDLAAVSLAMSSEETRYYLMGIFFHIAELKLRLAATDGHRLHRVSRDLPVGLTEFKDAILPRKAVTALMAAIALQPATETVRCEFGDTRARFQIGAVTLTTRLIDGTFPDYTRVIPKTAKGGIRVSTGEIVRPAKSAMRLMGRENRAMRMRPKDGTIAAKSPEGVEIEARLDREIIGAPCEEIGFRHEYLVDAMTPFGTAKVTMSADDSAAPCLIEEEGNDRLLVVLMPMRV
jgi:DNA polymerase-3 subunit beta